MVTLALIDLLVLFFLFAFILMGFLFGFIHTLGSIVGLVAGVYAAGHWYQPVATWLTPYLFGTHPNIVLVISFVLIFALISRLIAFLFGVIDKMVNILQIIPMVKTFNRIFGAILGLAEGVLILSLIIFVVSRYPVPGIVTEYLNQSHLVWYLSGPVKLLEPFIPDALLYLKALV